MYRVSIIDQVLPVNLSGAGRRRRQHAPFSGHYITEIEYTVNNLPQIQKFTASSQERTASSIAVAKLELSLMDDIRPTRCQARTTYPDSIQILTQDSAVAANIAVQRLCKGRTV